MSTCGCEDFPCCGHDPNAVHPDLRQYCQAAVEDARSFYEGSDPEEQEDMDRFMGHCPICGEWSSRTGTCALCVKDPVRERLPQAVANRNFHEARRAVQEAEGGLDED